MHPTQKAIQNTASGSIWEVFLAFLRLGVTSFGGPVAHLGYFRDEFVTRRRWLSEQSYADLVALCQFLPGPASSQVGFSLGILRGKGLRGGIAAWLGFTLPSAFMLFLFALSATALTGPVAAGFIHGLKLVAVAVVAQAVWGMSRTLAPDRPRAAIALAAVAIVGFFGGSIAQVTAIGLGAFAGLRLCREQQTVTDGQLGFPVTRVRGIVALVLFAALLLALPLIGALSKQPELALFDSFYRSGALVFGGGHVVLPLLKAETVASGWLTSDSFLAGYGVAQAVPGPLFTFAAYLGAVSTIPASAALNPLVGATVALIGVFLPGLLLAYGMLPFWDRFRLHPKAQFAMRGANAAVVGILGAALYDPVWTSAILAPSDFVLALAGFLSLTVWKAPPWTVVALLAAAGALSGLL